jgi:outer membrane lipoprotein-sorting protein
MMVIKKHNYSVAAFFIILLSLVYVSPSQVSAPNPRTVLREMIAQYESVSSYQDSGVIRVVQADSSLIADLGNHHVRSISFTDGTFVSFKTYFVRPRKFRFEWKNSFLKMSREAAIWTEGKRVYSWTPAMSRDDGSYSLSGGRDLRFKLEEARRPSAGAAFIIPSLLMPKDVGYLPFANMVNSMTELSLLGEEQSEGETCYVIKGKMYGTPWMLWVGKNSHLLRKKRTLYSVGGSFDETVETGKRSGETFMAEEIHRDIKINMQIPENVFRYKPKLQAQDDDLTR